MNEKSSGIKIICALLCALIMTLSSCLENNTSLKVKADGSGSVLLEYIVSDDLLYFAQYDDIESQITLPINEYEFRRISALSPGLDLAKYRSMRKGGQTHTSATLNFESLEALSPLFGSEYRYNSDPPTLRIPLVSGLADIDAEQKATIRAQDQAPKIVFRFSFSIAKPNVAHSFIGTAPALSPASAPALGSGAGTGSSSGSESRNNELSLSFAYSLQDLVDVDGSALIEFRWSNED